MLEIWRIKKTNEIVYPLSDNGKHTLCIFPLKHKSRKGNYADQRMVNNNNLVKDNDNPKYVRK